MMIKGPITDPKPASVFRRILAADSAGNPRVQTGYTRALASKKLRGFSLTELLIAMVILSVLVLLALPKLYPLVTKAKTKEAQIALATVKALQDAYKLEHDRFAATTEELGFVQEKTVSEGGTAKYAVTISSAGETGYEARATALVDFDSDGTFNVWVVNESGKIDEKIPD